MNLNENKSTLIKDIVVKKSESRSPLNLKTNFITWQIQDGIFMGYNIKLDVLNNIYNIYKPEKELNILKNSTPNEKILIQFKTDSLEEFMNMPEKDLNNYVVKQLAVDNAKFLLLKTFERLELLATNQIKFVSNLPKLALIPLLNSAPNSLHMFYGKELIEETQNEIYEHIKSTKTNVAECLKTHYPEISQILFYSLFENTANEYMELMADKCNNLLPEKPIKITNKIMINPQNNTPNKIYTQVKKPDAGRGGLGENK